MNMMNVWDDMNGNNRIGLLLGCFVVVLFLLLATVWLMRDQNAVLFSDLEQRDAASIVKELDKMKVDYQLEASGRNILVPQEVVHQTRLQLMSSGAPLSGGVGFEIFDSSDFGMTEFAQKINFQRALQGELTRTIMSLSEVQRARVHLVMAEHGLFKRESSGPSASVTIFLKLGAKLTEDEIVGIQRLIAAGVPDLKAEQVTISDQNGVTLNYSVPDEDSVEAVSVRLQQKKAVEDYLSKKAIAVLSSAFGESGVTISIDVDLDFSHVKKTQEDVLPSNGVNAAGVIRRRESKLGKGAMATADKGKLTTEVEYQLGRSIAQIVETPGKIMRLNIAVVVPNVLSDDEQSDIRELLSVAVGFNNARGDAIAIYSATSESHPGKTALADDLTPTAEFDRQTAAVQVVDGMITERWLLEIGRLFNTQEKKVLGIVLVAGFILFFMLLIYLVFRKKPSDTEGRRLSVQERDEILVQLNAWLQADAKNENLTEVKS